ncbi:MAG: hypothetical protein WB709_07410 [Solirubrobacteraceae bacterium]
MQDHFIPCCGQASSATHVTVPASVVDWLRRAAYAEIGSAAEEAAFASDREAHPEWFGTPAENLKEIYALLDTIGWSKTTPPTEAQIDPREDCWAFMRALTGALEFADEDANEETTRGEVEHTAPHLTLVQGGEAERRAGELWDCIAEAGARIDELAVAQDTGFVLDIAA